MPYALIMKKKVAYLTLEDGPSPDMVQKVDYLSRKSIPVFFLLTYAITWGIWHIPSMIYFGDTQVFGLGFAVLNFVPTAILYTWMYNTRGSLLLVTLLHVGQQLSNYFLGVIPSKTDEIFTWLFAIVIVLLSSKNDLQTKHLHTKRCAA